MQFRLSNIIDPSRNVVYQYFYMVILVTILFSSFFIPYTISFSTSPGWEPYDDGEAILYYVLTGIWCIDIIVTFNVGYFSSSADSSGNRRGDLISGELNNGSRLVTSRRRIANRYAQRDLWLDLLSVIPIAEIVEWATTDGASPNLKRYLLLFRLAKLFQMRKLWQFVVSLQEDIRFPYIPIVIAKYVALILILTNFAACVLYFLAELQDFSNQTYNGAFAKGYNTAENYVLSLYWSVVTLTTVGYGDLSPKGTSEQIFAILYMLFNMIVLAYLLAIVTLFVVKGSSMALHHSEHSARLKAIKHPDGSQQLPKNVLHSLDQHLELYHSSKGIGGEDLRVMSYYPKPLQHTVGKFMYMKAVRKNYMYRGVSKQLLNLLFRDFTIETYSAWTTIIEENETIDELYILLKGSVRHLDASQIDSASVKEATDYEIRNDFHDSPEFEDLNEPSGHQERFTHIDSDDGINDHDNEGNLMHMRKVKRPSSPPSTAIEENDIAAEGSILGASAFFSRGVCPSHIITTSLSKVGVVPRSLWAECVNRYPFDTRKLVSNMYLYHSKDGENNNHASIIKAAIKEIKLRMDDHILNAARFDDVSSLRQIHTAGADIEGAESFDGCNVYSVAADNASEKVIRYLLRNNINGINRKNVQGILPLMTCLYKGEFKSAKLLRKAGANFVERSSDLVNIFKTIVRDDNRELLLKFLELGADPTTAADDVVELFAPGQSNAVLFAIQSGKFELAEIMVNHCSERNNYHDLLDDLHESIKTSPSRINLRSSSCIKRNVKNLLLFKEYLKLKKKFRTL